MSPPGRPKGEYRSAQHEGGPASPPQPLDPLSFPLRGSRLIEASAGTGKTYTITALYLRLILGHGGEPAGFGRALTPPEILVVTFTEAATQELRDRIRTRLAEAAQAFQQDAQGPAPDGLLDALRSQYPPGQWPAHARTLRLAAEWMDEAAVSTIHAWCHRMLAEHAFDSGSLFTQTLQADQRALQAEAVRDYWRTFLTPLAAAHARQVRQWWDGPQALQADLARLGGLREALSEGQAPEQALQQARAQCEQALAALKAPWAGECGWAHELAQALDAAVAAKQCKMPRRREWMQALRQWAEGDALLPALTSTAWERLSPAGLAKDWSGDAALLSHPCWQALAGLRATVQALPDARETILRHATGWCAERMQAEQARRAEMGFDELLARLDAALQGPNGPRLAASIRRQFPAALIDEFQDTDPLQYRIFDAIYGVRRNDPDTALILIGDPKQAIYAFRGADIYTYLAARRDTEGRHATLDMNYRSSADMVQAVNHLFLQAEQRPQGQGAFLFRDAQGEVPPGGAAPDDSRPGGTPLPFVPVRARGRGESWLCQGRPAPALTCWTLAEDAVQGGDAQHAMAQSCATAIVQLLQQGQQGQAGFGSPQGPLRPVGPGDIAVLVHNGREARAVRQALGQRGVRSVYLSDKDSVFQTGAAAELQRWLAACAEPEDDRLLRAALGTASLGLDWSELDRLNHDEARWEERVAQFHAYQGRWRRQGVLPMLRHLLHDFGVPGRLLALGEERRLTDLLHLAELLQQASASIDGEHALIRWLAEQRQEGGDSEARKLRLESDADRVKVVTVHKSKGLEYPLVFLPFANTYRAVKPRDLPLRWHDGQGRLQVSLRPDPHALARADHERLGEDLRKLYVALTRARHATWIGAAPQDKPGAGALGYLLGLDQPQGPASLEQALQALARACPAIVAEAAPAPGTQAYRPPAHTARAAPEPSMPPPAPAWWIASYSALGIAAPRPEDELDDPDPQPAQAPADAAQDIYADSLGEAGGPLPEPQPAAQAGTLHAFARGPQAGSFLHGLLEWAGRAGFARAAGDPATRRALAGQIEQRCTLAGWPQWAAPLQDWMEQWLRTGWPLPAAPGQAPARVAPAAMQATQIEMEFWFSVQGVQAQALDALVCRHTLDAMPRPALAPRRLHGMLKGFIDLVFEHEGRYYVADYKSNWLGPADEHYGPQALRQAIAHHRYDVQYVLYIFALHRLLMARLPGYDYDSHIGGAVYLFLRGHGAASQGVHAERPPRALIEALEALVRGVGQDDAAPAAGGRA
ncbi:exodeoxyribonuclease V subunit beta [Orrella sp. JC864]|uniref:exodeoxyribonuclease V subunit beta n=1 Tax=Orrella sp. JC864 TaxID=3120298 RepID=UPI003008572F